MTDQSARSWRRSVAIRPLAGTRGSRRGRGVVLRQRTSSTPSIANSAAKSSKRPESAQCAYDATVSRIASRAVSSHSSTTGSYRPQLTVTVGRLRRGERRRSSGAGAGERGVVHVDSGPGAREHRPGRQAVRDVDVLQRLEREHDELERDAVATAIGVRRERVRAECAPNFFGRRVVANAQHHACATAVHGHLVLEFALPDRPGPSTYGRGSFRSPHLIGADQAGLKDTSATVSDTTSSSTTTSRSRAKSAGSRPVSVPTSRGPSVSSATTIA